MNRYGFPISVDKNTVPDDLEVFVIKSDQGYFWNLKADWERPKTLGEWENGYSCGIAISKKYDLYIGQKHGKCSNFTVFLQYLNTPIGTI